MSAFTFEFWLKGETILSERLDIPAKSAIWSHVEAMALRQGPRAGAYIRVRDDKGHVVVRAGVATALAAIDACPYGGCAMKEAARGGPVPAAPEDAPCRAGVVAAAAA